MKLLITRPVVITGDGGTRSFVPGLTVEVDAATAEQILDRKAGIAAGDPQGHGRAPRLFVRPGCSHRQQF